MRSIHALLLLSVIAGGCRHHGSDAPSLPVARDGQFHSAKLGVGLDIPDGWQRQASAAYALAIAPVGRPDTSISLDVPDLPVHVPGLIPLGMVKDGYLDDLKKQWPGMRIVEDRAYDLPGAKAHWVRSVRGDGQRQETAALIVRGDRVYILRATGPADDAALGSALARVLASLRWS